MCQNSDTPLFLFRLKVGVLCHIEAWTRLSGIKVVVTYDHSTGITLPQVGEQLPHGCLLRRCARVGFFTADVESALVADADGVCVVVQAVVM